GCTRPTTASAYRWTRRPWRAASTPSTWSPPPRSPATSSPADHLPNRPRRGRRCAPFGRTRPAAPAGTRRRPSRSCVSSRENATSSAASHATCVLAIRSNVRSCATGASLPCSRLCGVVATPPWPGATDGLGASIGVSAAGGWGATQEESGGGGLRLPVEPVVAVGTAAVEVPPAEPPPPGPPRDDEAGVEGVVEGVLEGFWAGVLVGDFVGDSVG